MEGWSGFTDEQLQRFKGQDDDTQKPPIRKKEARKNTSTNRNKTREKLHQKQCGRVDAEDKPLEINQMLSAPTVHKTNEPKEGRRKIPSQATDKNAHTDDKSVKEVQPHGEKPVDGEKGRNDKEEMKAENKDNVKTVEVNELNEAEGRSRELSQLEIIQKKQIEMEEENRKKKIALTKAINERRKRTQAETKQLAFIQKELGKLESLLTTDVRILREKIETSSFDYNAARRRYEKAEHEFVAAKVHLHKVSEQKEALTEHLYTIIQENENRKAHKLSELMEKLNVENIDEFIAAAEEEMNREPISPTHVDTVSSSAAQPSIGCLENGQSSPQNTSVSSSVDTSGTNSAVTNDQSSEDSDKSSLPSTAASESSISSQCGLETITEVDLEVTTDVLNKEELNGPHVPDKA